MTFIASKKFPDNSWDGLCYQYDSHTIDKDPSFFWKDACTQEIVAIESYLIDFRSTFDFFKHYGDPHTIVSVNDDSSELVYRELVAGSGISIAWGEETVTIEASAADAGFSGVAGETLSIGDVVRIHTDGKIYKAIATANRGQIVGISNQNAILDDTIKILSSGDITNGAWSLTIGDIYYLSGTIAGGITNTSPAVIGQAIMPVGVALATDRLAIDLRIRIKV